MNSILDRIAQIANNENISIGKLERIIGASKGVLSRAIANKSDIQSKWIIKIVENYPQYSGDWLLTGSGEMNKQKDEISRVHCQILQDNEKSARSIPLIPQEAFAGYGTFEYSDLPIEEFYQVNEFNKADFLIRVKGDSMTPKYNGGDIVACMKVNEITFWQWHRIYVIYTKNQGILIKRVEEHPNPAFITLVSENPSYKPFQLHEDEIEDVALVLGAITLE